MNRSIVLDIETTHLNVNEGRITEIACIELIDNQMTNNTFHTYLNPEITVSEESFKITNLSNEFLSKQPLFEYIVTDLLNFIQNDTIIAHNATFDISYINKELSLLNMPILSNNIVDTLQIARKKYKQGNSLSSLCKRFNINTHMREFHGAMIDAELLAGVYHYLIHDEISLNLELTFEEIQEVYTSNVIYNITTKQINEHEAFMEKHKFTSF